MDTATSTREQSAEFRGRVYDSIVDTIGATPLVRIHRLAEDAGAKADILAQVRVLQPARLGQGPHRGLDDRGRRGRRPDQARHRAGRADLRQHRDRARLRLRREGLPADPDDAGQHVARTPQDADVARRRARTDPGRARHARRHRQGRGDRRHRCPTPSSRSNSRTRPTPRSTAARRPRKSGRTPAARSMSWSAGSAPAAP